MAFIHPLAKSKKLKRGDKVAIVSPSWGGAGVLGGRYAAGKQQLLEVFGLEAVDMPHTLAAPDFVAANPALRAQDIMAAFRDPSIAAVIAAIGGDDCIRLLPHLDLDVIRDNPKIFLGYSDTTALHFACLAAGVAPFYGPSLLSGFAENGGMHAYTIKALQRALFDTDPPGLIPANQEGWTVAPVDWGNEATQGTKRPMQKAYPPRMLQGQGQASGRLIGGCAEVLEMLKATAWWPPLDFWDGAILFYETSEETPSPHLVKYWLRNYAAQGILQRLSGIVLARPDPGGDETYQMRLENTVIEALAEAGLTQLPVLSGLDFGHTQPMLTLPYGAKASIDCQAATLTLLESGVC
jgi:muramoyltetrapeptide carboxypeptidase LdcA involved in peptidoglycan recycling